MPHPQVLRDMALFVEVAKRKSFSQAAAALGMPISSLSRRITLFESAIGLRLLDRTTRKLVLTAVGEAYLAQATRLVEEAQRAFDDMVAQAKGPSGFLKVAVPPDFWVLRHLSGVITDFAKENELVQVHVDLRPPPVDLAGQAFDLAIATEEPRETSLIVRKVGDLENALYASRSYLAANGRPEHPNDLAQHRVLLPTQGSTANWVLYRKGDRATVTVGGPISCNSLSMARRFALIGEGITLSNVISVDQDVASGRLERVLPDWWLPSTPVYIVTTSRLLPAKSRSFIEFAQRRLGAILANAGKASHAMIAAPDVSQDEPPKPIYAFR